MEEQERAATTLQVQLDEATAYLDALENEKLKWKEDEKALQRELTDKELIVQKLSDTVEQAEKQTKCRLEQMELKMERERMGSELRIYRAVEDERKKWELREERIFSMTRARAATETTPTYTEPVPKTVLRAEARDFCPTMKDAEKKSCPELMMECPTGTREVEEKEEAVSETETVYDTTHASASAMTPARFPPIPKFSGRV